MYAQERQQHIAQLARAQGRVEVLALAQELGVTTETVRRDLTALERRGSVRRVHGGALPSDRLELEPTVQARQSHLAAEKRRIAARALDELPSDGTVLLDTGTTTGALAELLPTSTRLTVLTNSFAHAGVLGQLPQVDVLLLGGRVRRLTGAAVGPWARAALQDVCVDVAFLGANGVTPERGFTTPDQAEAEVKAAMVAAARRVVVLADASKVGEVHLHRFAELGQVDLLVTDTTLDDEHAQELRAADDAPEVARA
ncbi:DeoR/GlpR family DNA-binding transcription regulator [Ornithinimicrobium sp. W1679]|uniref:DeoR/GlpR family DNA-binding transcription regulator n=1 Tax=unclassified Ornithinimicrobium TaxID=2615080 RepID=UPI003CEE888D